MTGRYRFKNLDWVNTLFLTLTPPLALISIFLYFRFESFSWSQLVLAFIFYIVTGLSITAGYHRLISHRAYKAHPIVKFFFLLFGAATFQNSALKWCSDHRIHHNKVDGDEDPYNINEGFFYAHMGWVMLKERSNKPDFPKDLATDPLILWQHKHYLVIAVFMGIILPTVIGHFLGSALGGFALAGIGRVVFVHHATFLINSACHVWGKQTYTDTNSARDSHILAFLSYGEGHHNFHHCYQADYRNGVRFFHFDPTKWLIKGLSFFNLTWDLRETPDEELVRARLRMQEKKLGTAHPHIQALREQIEHALVHLQKMKREQRQLAQSAKNELTEKMILAKRELDEMLVLWRRSLREARA